LEEDWPLDVEEDEILVFLSIVGGTDVIYKIPLLIEFEERWIQKEQGPNRADKRIYWVDPNAWIDQPDYQENDAEADLVAEEAKCVPIFTKTTPQGDVFV
jgi:hypothetical protein